MRGRFAALALIVGLPSAAACVFSLDPVRAIARDASIDASSDAFALDAQTPCVMTHAFCDDFDGRDAGWSASNVMNGTAVPDHAEWVSPPRSLHTEIPAASSFSSADWEKDFAQSWQKTKVDMDLWVLSPSWDAGASGANVTLLEVLFRDSKNDPVTGSIVLSQDGLAVGAQPGDGGFVSSTSTPLTPNAWHHLTLVTDPSPEGASVVVTVDGSSSPSVNYTPRASSGSASIGVLVGPAAYNAGATATPPYDFHIDNVTVDFPGG